MQVHEVPTYEEFFGLSDNELSDEEFEPNKEEDDKVKKILAIALSLLQEFYLVHMYDTEYFVCSEEFEEQLEDFNNELKENIIVLFNSYIVEVQSELNLEWTIPSGVVKTQLEIEEIISSGVDSITGTLYLDLKNKADFYKELATTTGQFSLHSNFRRAVKKLKGVVGNNAHHVGKIIERDYLTFVYGQEALFYWRCSGINTCAWCYSIEAMGAMPLSWFPVDHINGRCELVPANPNEYSDEYTEIRGW